MPSQDPRDEEIPINISGKNVGKPNDPLNETGSKPLNSADVFSDEVNKALEEARQKRGRVNIMLAGKTGVGKSTLINAVFQGKLATTGSGRPVTQKVREITKEGIPLSIFDTRGLEMAALKETQADILDLVRTRRADSDAGRHIHLAWVCIAEDSRRVEEAESRLVELLAQYMPVIGVITKARADKGPDGQSFRSQVQELLPQVHNVIRVRAIAEEDDEGNLKLPMGLIDLVDLSMNVVPEAYRNALAAAQKVDLEAKVRRAQEAIALAAASAAAAGAAPIPFTDALLLVPIQITMLAQITAIFGVPLEQGFLSTLLASIATGGGATVLGRSIVANLLKLIPGAGSAAGAVVAASTASILTVACGEAYIAALTLLFKQTGGEPPAPEAIKREFQAQLTKRTQRP